MNYECHNPQAGPATEVASQCDLLIFAPNGRGAASAGEVAVLDARGDAALTDLLDFTEGVDAFGLTWCRIPEPSAGLWRVQVVALYDADGEIAVLQFIAVERADCPVVL